MKTGTTPDKKFVVIIVLLLCLIYIPYILSQHAAEQAFVKGDCYYYLAIIISMLNDGDLKIADNVSVDPLNGQLALGKEGLVPKHPILMPLISIPFFILFDSYGLLVFNVMNSIILILLIFKLNRLFVDEYISFLTSLLYAVGTLFLNYSYNYSPDLFSTLLLASGLYFIFKERFYFGAAFLGLSIFAKLSNVLPVGLILLYSIFIISKSRIGISEIRRKDIRNRLVTLTAFLLIFFISLIPFGYANYYLFGSPFTTGYQKTAISGERPGEIAIYDHKEQFNQPLLSGSFKLLFHPLNGIIPTNPIIILAFLGMFLIKPFSEKLKIYLMMAICLIQFLFIAKYDYWHASHYSNRFMMTFILLSSVFTSVFFTRMRDKFLFSKS